MQAEKEDSICIFSMIGDKLQSNSLVLHSFNVVGEGEEGEEGEEIFDIADKSWRQCVTGLDGV